MQYQYLYPLIAFLFIPLLVNADYSGPGSVPTFENQQNLVFSATISDSSNAVTNKSSVSIPLKSPQTITYHVNHSPLWPNYNVTPDVEDGLFQEILAENQLYLDLWEGVPFTSSAHKIETWNISNSPNGTVKATFSSPGTYFLIAYVPDAYYQDPQSICPGDIDWVVDCAPSYTLEQMDEYFSSSLPSPTLDIASYAPDAFGGTQFTIDSPPSTKASNVLFLPGIEGSRLYMKNSLGFEQNLWEPSVLNSVQKLTLNPDGSSQNKIYTRDLVNYPYGISSFGEVYGPFENFMNTLVASHIIEKWLPFPYDWRYDVGDIVQNGTLVGTASNPPITVRAQDTIQSLASTSPTGKVTIIAHSNGGLLAKALAIDLQKRNLLRLIDQIILIGSPQFGTPLSIGSLLHGDGQTDAAGGLLLYGGVVRAAASTMPGMYGLLPSSEYFQRIADAPVRTATSASNNIFEKYLGKSVSTFLSLQNFLTDVTHLDSNFPADDLRTPLALSSSILKKEAATHAQIDSWKPPSDIKLSIINGWGNLTPYQYVYSSTPTKSFSCFQTGFLSTNCRYSYRVQRSVNNTEDGDNTVVSSKSLTASENNYLFNAKSYSKDRKGIIGHGNLTSATPIQGLLKSLIIHASSTIEYISSSTPSGGTNPLTVLGVHSPVNITATDPDGNQTGIFPVPDKSGIYFKKELIPGSTLQILDDEKYLYLPPDTTYTISLSGYDAGETTLTIGELASNGSTLPLEEFADIPTTASTTATFVLSPLQDGLVPEIHVDIFGDGSTTSIESSSSTTASTTKSRMKTKELLRILEKEFHIVYPHKNALGYQWFLLVFGDFLSPIVNSAAIISLENFLVQSTGSSITLGQGNFFLHLLDVLNKSH